MSKITNFLNKDVMNGHEEEPKIEENIELINGLIKQLSKLDYLPHTLQRKGLEWLLNEFKRTTLNFIPTNILRNSLGPITTYISLSKELEKKDINELKEMFFKEYEKTISSLNYYINIEEIEKL